MKRRLRVSLVLCSLAVVSLATLLILRSGDRLLRAPVITQPQPDATTTPRHVPTHEAKHQRAQAHSLVRLVTASTAREAQEVFSDIRRELLGRRDGAVALAELIDFLEQGYDRSLGASLQVGAGGELRQAPTARVAVLDLLGVIDSQQAAAYSRQLLETSTSSDEWAIALRNYAWGVDNPAQDSFLRTKVHELLTNDAWILQPTAGFLESFDFVPFTLDPSLIEPLVNLTNQARNSSVRRAAVLALERVVSRNTTVGLMAVTASEREKSFSVLRADTIARADLTRPSDVQLLREYLLSSSIETREFQIFASMFPHGGQFAGHSLVSTFEPKPFAELAKRDAHALRVVASWMEDPIFVNRRHELQQMYDRLVTLNESAVRGGYL